MKWGLNRQICFWELTILCFLIFFQQNLVADTPDMAKAIFSEAQATFKLGLNQKGDRKRLTMIKAANQFQSLLTDFGIENSKLYYNIGNSYYEAGEMGKAILFYRKAERLSPGFIDLKHNLNQAKQNLNLPVSEKEWWADIVKGLFFWHFMLDYSLRRTIFLAAFCCFWIFMICLIFLRHIFIKIGFVLATCLILGFGYSFLYSTYQIYFVQSGVITVKQVLARKGPGVSYEKFYEQGLVGGTEFKLMEKQGSWWKVKLSNGDEVWVEKDNAELI